jgi:LAO/AO transport system kinase
VLVPESGDSVQAMKAGLMEIADFFVLNKSDRPAAEQALTALKTILMMKDHDKDSWLPNIIKAVAVENKGIEDIAGEIEKHKEYLTASKNFLKKRETQAKARIIDIVEEKLRSEILSKNGKKFLNSTVGKVVRGSISPYQIAEEIIEEFKKNS